MATCARAHGRQVSHIFPKHRGALQLIGATSGEASPSLALVEFVVHPVVAEAKESGLTKPKQGAGKVETVVLDVLEILELM